MVAFKVILILTVVISAMGMLTDKNPTKYQIAFGLAGAMFLLSEFIPEFLK